MTLTSTIRRREKRKRAKAAAAERAARWAAMSPQDREIIESSRRMFAEAALPILRQNMRMAALVNRRYS